MAIQRLFVLLFAVSGWAFLGSGPASAQSVKITQSTKYYTITGKTAAEFAHSMSRRGPYSRQHRRRAWATAGRDLSFQLVRQKTSKSCRSRGAKVRMKITYTYPKLRGEKRLSSRQRKKWRRMIGLLRKHEQRHGSYYKQLANETYRALKKLKPARTCRQLEQQALKVVKKLAERDSRRNDRFDRNDRANYRAMSRLYRSS